MVRHVYVNEIGEFSARKCYGCPYAVWWENSRCINRAIEKRRNPVTGRYELYESYCTEYEVLHILTECACNQCCKYR